MRTSILASLFVVTNVVSAGLALAVDAPAPATPPVQVQFNRDIRPILSDNCFACHGFDERTRKAGLRLDVRDAAISKLKSDAHAIVPGDAAKSELINRVTTADADDIMPPVKSGKKLTAQQKQLLRDWIAQGAPYEKHWAFVSPQRAALPDVGGSTWPRNEIDRFVLATLNREGLKPSPEAERATLLRRVTLDITGLPPTVAELDAFLADKSPEAYEKLVDRLLASTRYGERMAMWWLDGARYADSNGFQVDDERIQWRWREWVIDAFNSNQPFDQFSTDQIAGDMLPNATIEQRIATGFNRNHRINTEGGALPQEWAVEMVIDRVDTMGQVWLGLTLGCARCHDHKYDPITQKDFYQFFSFFNNIPESGIGDGQGPIAHRPFVRAPRKTDLAKLAEIDAQIAAAQAQVKEAEGKIAATQVEWEKTALGMIKKGVLWKQLMPQGKDALAATGSQIAVDQDGVIAVTGANPATTTYTIKDTIASGEISAIRVDALPDKSLSGSGPGRSVNGNFVLTDVDVLADGKPVALVKATATFSQEGFPVANVIDRNANRTGWAIHPRMGETHTLVISFEKPVSATKPVELTIKLAFNSPHGNHQFGKFRLSITDSKTPHESSVSPTVIAALELPADKRTPQQSADLARFFRENYAGDLTKGDREIARLQKERVEAERTMPTVMVMEEMAKPRQAHILLRGQYDKPGAPVSAALPTWLNAAPKDVPMNRVALAKWLVDAENPLTARVAVNRFWENLFGTGLVKSSENFGTQGDWPSHPELLDWLAVEFATTGKWDVKAITKKIVLSATYRQASTVTPALVERDPENRLLARGPRFRVQAETVRDNALFIAGLLTEQLGGPSSYPYQPAGIWDELTEYGNLRNYKHAKDASLYRRSMYTIWKRTSAPPNMIVFDMGGREVCAVKRSRTNTPLQALTLMNDVTFIEAARVLAEKAILEGGKTPKDRLTYVFRRAVSRPPSAQELSILSAGLTKRMQRFRAKPEDAKRLIAQGEAKADPTIDPAELAAYTMTVSVVLNLDETITKE